MKKIATTNRLKGAEAKNDFMHVYHEMADFAKQRTNGDPVVLRKSFTYTYTCYIYDNGTDEETSWDEFDKLIERYEAGETVEGVSTESRKFMIQVSIHDEPEKGWLSVSTVAALHETDGKWDTQVRFATKDEGQINNILWGTLCACNDFARHDCP